MEDSIITILSTGNIHSTLIRHGILPLTRFVKVSWMLFLGTIVCQIINTALREQHSNSIGYWFYILLLEGPIMVFNLFIIYTFQQWIALKRNFPFVVVGGEVEGGGGIPTPPTILWSYGSLTMPGVESISHDVQLAATIPLACGILCGFWILVYVVFEDNDGPLFDDTFWNGVDMTEMSSFEGVLDNIAAQAFWRCLTLGVMSLILPTFPMSASSLWVALLLKCFPTWNLQKIAFAVDLVGTIMTLVLLLIGFYETIWDDDNGVGIWHLFNSTILLIITLPRLLLAIRGDASDASNHVLLGRPCYQEKETLPPNTTTMGTTNTNNKEQELTETGASSTTTMMTTHNNNDIDNTTEMITSPPPPETSEIV